MTERGHHERPQSLVRALRHLRERIPPDRVDRLWLFPVLEWEKRETGVVVIGCFDGKGRGREVHTLTFQVGRVQGGRSAEAPFEAQLETEGTVPADRLPRIIAGVSHRLRGEHAGEPEEVEIEGRIDRFDALLPAASPPQGSTESESGDM